MRGYGEVLEDHPDFVPARLYRAEALWLSGKREEARDELSRARSELLLFRILAATFGSESELNPVAVKLSDAYPSSGDDSSRRALPS